MENTNKTINILETQEQAIQAGVPAEVFDADVHLFHEVVEVHDSVETHNAGE